MQQCAETESALLQTVSRLETSSLELNMQERDREQLTHIKETT